MRRIIATVVVGTAVLVVAWYVAHLTGEVSATIAGVTVQASAPVAILLVAIVVLIAHLILRLLSGLLGMPQAIGFWSTRRRRMSGDTAVTHTLLALAAGDQGDARREAGRARRLLGDTPQTLLLAAEAQRLNNEEAEAARLYGILAERQDGAFLGLRGLFRQAMAREDWAEATALARRAEAAYPGGAWLRTERAELAVRTADWTQALALSAPGRQSAVFAAAAAEAETNPEEALRLARRAWTDDQGFTPAALAFARRLRRAGRENRARAVLRTTWSHAPHPDLAALLLEPITDSVSRLGEAKRLVSDQPKHPESRLLLAQLSLEAGLAADARRHLDELRQTGFNQRRMWVLLSQIESTHHGDTEQGRDAQRDALLHAAASDADPAWRCEACGTQHSAWHPACPACHAAGRITWSIPTRLAIAG